MSIYINQFVDRLKSADARQQRDFVMSMSDAKNLHADITKLLLALQELQNIKSKDASTIPSTVEVDGGSF